jgi:lipid-A-disaccharide synthase
VSFLTWVLARLFIRIPYIGLVNVVAGKKVVPELIQQDATPDRIASVALSLLNNAPGLAQIHADLSAVKKILGLPGACGRAAQEILNFLNEKTHRIDPAPRDSAL